MASSNVPIKSLVAFSEEVQSPVVPYKNGLPRGTEAPKKARSIVSVVSPTRGVIHPTSLSEAGGNDLRKAASKPLILPTAVYLSPCKTRLLLVLMQALGHSDASIRKAKLPLVCGFLFAQRLHRFQIGLANQNRTVGDTKEKIEPTLLF
jgi:hypothetical protein